MRDLHHFDYEAAAREAGINDVQLRAIERLFRADYPSDDMLFELHVLRVCRTVQNNPDILPEILREAEERGASAA